MVLGIYGAGGLGREVLELATIINKKENRWEDIVFVIDGVPSEKVNGVLVYSFEDALSKYKGNIEVAMGVGEPATRERLFKKLEENNLESPTLIHPDVYIPNTTIVEKGATIQFGCFISCNVKIEKNVFIQPQVNIGHDDIIKEGAVISGFANLAGHVTVGKYSYIGLSTAIKENVSVGDYSIVGMYSAVYKDIPDEMIAMGNPARPLKKNEDRNVFK